MLDKVKLPEYPLPEPPKLTEKAPKLGERATTPVKEVLGDKGVGKIIGDVLGGIGSTADSVVTGGLRVGDSVVGSIDKTLRGLGKE